jgi:hypothetical protein
LLKYVRSPPSPADDENKRIASFTELAKSMKTEIRELLDERSVFASYLDLLLSIQVPNEVRIAVLRDELLDIEESHRSVALCYRLDPGDEKSSAAFRMLAEWGIESGVDKVVVQDILQWPDCPPNAVFPVVRELARLKNQPEKDLGDRLGLVVMEQFADWARRNGYNFREKNLRRPPPKDVRGAGTY